MAALDWTQVIVATIAAVASIGNAAIAAWVYVQLKSPSGKRVGEMIERTEHLANVNTMQLMQMNGESRSKPGDPPHHEVG